MRASKFCLHPAGDTPSSCRLFDAIVSHCVPVIISDQIELPYEDELDYSEFSLFFSTDEALKPGYLIKQLRQFPKDKWLTMWNKLKNISHHFEFQYPSKSSDAVNMIWRQVRHKLPYTKLTIHRTRRLKIPDWWESKRWDDTRTFELSPPMKARNTRDSTNFSKNERISIVTTSRIVVCSLYLTVLIFLFIQLHIYSREISPKGNHRLLFTHDLSHRHVIWIWSTLFVCNFCIIFVLLHFVCTFFIKSQKGIIQTDLWLYLLLQPTLPYS